MWWILLAAVGCGTGEGTETGETEQTTQPAPAVVETYHVGEGEEAHIYVGDGLYQVRHTSNGSTWSDVTADYRLLESGYLWGTTGDLETGTVLGPVVVVVVHQ